MRPWYLQIPGPLLRDRRLSALEKIGYAYLEFRGASYRGPAVLAADIGESLRTAKRLQSSLENKGIVTFTKGGGRGHKTRLQKLLPLGDWLGGNGDKLALFQTEKQCQVDTVSGAQTVPKMSLNSAKLSPLHIMEVKKVQESNARVRKRKPPKYTPDFERFWELYPRKIGKAETFAEWEKIGPDAELVLQIIEAVMAWARSEQWTKDEGKYILYPVRFLRNRRFEDELPCSPEPQRGDPDWYPDAEEVDRVMGWGKYGEARP